MSHGPGKLMRAVIDLLPPEGATVAELTEMIYGPDWCTPPASSATRDSQRGGVRRAAYALERRGEVELEMAGWELRKPPNSLLVRRPSRPWSPAEAAEAARRLPVVHGGRARYEPYSYADADEPASDHTLVRLEAVGVVTDTDSMSAVESALADLPGTRAYGTTRDNGNRRPFAWVLLDGDGSECFHRREGWHRV